MATCILEHCENAGQPREINFFTHQTREKFYANVSMCAACYAELWRAKRAGHANYDVLYRPSHESIDFAETRNFADVEAMRFQQTGD